MNGGVSMMCLVVLAIIGVIAIALACYIDSGANE